MMLRLFQQYYPIRNIFFVVGEGSFILISVIIASWGLIGFHANLLDTWMFFKIVLITIVCQTCLYFNDLYDLKVTDSIMELGIRLLQALGLSAFILAGMYFVFPELIVREGIFGNSIIFILIFIISWRFFYMVILNRGIFNQKIILLGSGELENKIEKEIFQKKDCGYTVSIKVLENPNDEIRQDNYTNTPLIIRKGYDGLCELAKEMSIRKVIVAITEKRGAFPTNELLKCRVHGIEVLDGNSFYEMLTGKLIVEQLNPAWLIFSEGFRKSRMRRLIKRSEDLLLSSLLLILLSPMILIISILIKLDSKGPVIFSQERVGQNEEIYRILKFRSMVSDAEKKSGPIWAKADDDRITRVGKIIRKLRIDEIPQIWNVLKGEMSFVGPRPERQFFTKELEAVIPYYRERFSVKPGITGWAQISYGYGASLEDAIEKLNYDLFYIKNMSTFMDLIIVLRTIKTVLFSKGAR